MSYLVSVGAWYHPVAGLFLRRRCNIGEVGKQNPTVLVPVLRIAQAVGNVGSADFSGGRGGDVKSIVLSLQNETKPTAQSHPTRSPDRQLRHQSI